MFSTLRSTGKLDVLLVPALSFALCLLATPLMRRCAQHFQLIDRPDGRRKLHGRGVPVAGGLALFAATWMALACCLWMPGWCGELLAARGTELGGLVLGSVVICVVGVADDFGCLRRRYKLLGQLVAVGVVMRFGVQVESIHLFGWRIELGLLGLPFTAFLLLGAINSLNLLDGMDGLLSSVGLIICVALGVIALVGGQTMAACVAFALAGALLAFLIYNFPPASIFLGDSGSMLIGLTVGVLAIQSSLKGPATVALATPTALLVIPIFDTIAAILRRSLTGRSIYSTDRGHLHHCLLNRGLTVRCVLLLVSCCCLAVVAGALASLFLKNELIAVLSAAAVIAMLVTTRLFGHTELALVAKRLRTLAGSLLHLKDQDGGRGVEVRLQGSVEWTELWRKIVACAPRLNLRSLRFDVNAPAIHEGYHARWDRPQSGAEEGITLWRAAIPLSVGGRTIGEVGVVGCHDDEPIWRKIAALAEMVQGFEAAASLLTVEAWRAVPRLQPPGLPPLIPEKAPAV